MITKFRLFREQLENENKPPLHYYAFDYDDNLLFMATEIMLLDDRGVEVGMETHDYAKYRSIIGTEEFDYKGYNIVGYITDKEGNIDFGESFRNFRDDHDPLIFLKDTKNAIREKAFGPSWDDFIECLTSGSIFAIITARGHESPTIRNVVEYLINNFLNDDQRYTMYNNILKYHYLFNNNHDRQSSTYPSGKLTDNKLVKEYLDLCEYIGVSAPSRTESGSAASPEDAKKRSLLKFNRKINDYAGRIGRKARIGFSDDDTKTVGVIEDLFNEVDNEEFPHIIQWVVKNTNKPDDVTKSINNTNE